MTQRTGTLAAVAALAVACGGSSGSSSKSLFACDLRTRPPHICEEIRAPAAEVAAEDVSGQCASAGGTWGFDLCVDTSLTGSCAYSLGPADFERHFYPPGPGYDPVFWCTMSSWDGVHGVWRPAP